MSDKLPPGTLIAMKPEVADDFLHPWRDRIAKGLTGEILAYRPSGYLVQMHPKRKVRNTLDWVIGGISSQDFEVIPPKEASNETA